MHRATLPVCRRAGNGANDHLVWQHAILTDESCRQYLLKHQALKELTI